MGGLAGHFLQTKKTENTANNQGAQAGIDQILEKGYADKYRQRGKKIILMGISFDTEKRNLSEWKIA